MKEKNANKINLGNWVVSFVNDELLDMNRKIIEIIKTTKEDISKKVFGRSLGNIFFSSKFVFCLSLFLINNEIKPKINVTIPAKIFIK